MKWAVAVAVMMMVVGASARPRQETSPLGICLSEFVDSRGALTITNNTVRKAVDKCGMDETSTRAALEQLRRQRSE
jgi:hypothetical protein